MPQLPGTDLTVSELCLGGNVFGWTADEPTSFAILDRYADAPPSAVAPFVDTAESYGTGESERIVGAWMASRGNRDSIVVATKASPLEKEHPLSAGETIDSPRAKGASQYVGEKGDRVLAALAEVADAHQVTGAAVALRWLADQPTVVAPIASGRSVEQLADLLPMQDLVLTDEQRQRLTDAS